MFNLITIAFAIVISISIIFDYITRSETVPIASLAVAIISIVLQNVIGLAMALLAIPLSRVLDIIKMMKTGRSIAYHLLFDLAPIVLALLTPLVIVVVSSRVLFIGMSKWVSELLFTTIFLLLLSSIIEPSFAIETLSKWMFIKPEALAKIMLVMGHIIGLISILLTINILSLYGILAFLIWILALFIRKRVTASLKISIELTPYIIVLVAVFLKDL